MKTDRTREKKNKKKKWVVRTVVVCVLLLTVMLTVGIILYKKFKKSPNEAHRKDKRRQEVKSSRPLAVIEPVEMLHEPTVRQAELSKEVEVEVTELEEDEQEAETDPPRKRITKGIKSLLKPAICIGIICLPLFFVGIVRVAGSSMQPALNSGDYVIYLHTNGRVEVGDIILFERDGEKYIKRVYAVAGDTVVMDGNKTLLVNGKPQLIEGLIVMGANDARDMETEIKVGQDEYFVLGDHRSVSLDSRDSKIGMVKQEEIFGKYLLSIRR